jgi:hypothetical protein
MKTSQAIAIAIAMMTCRVQSAGSDGDASTGTGVMVLPCKARRISSCRDTFTPNRRPSFGGSAAALDAWGW